MVCFILLGSFLFFGMDTRQKSEIAFKEFLELIQKVTSHEKDLHRKLQKCYERTNPHFRWSRGFINLVSLCSEKISDSPEKRLLHIQEFTDELNNYKAKPLKHLIKNAACVSNSDDSSTDESPLLNGICMTECSKMVSSSDMDVASNSENKSEDHVVGWNCTVDSRAEKRKHSDDLKGPNTLSTGNENESESRKKKRMFYNSTSLSGLLATPYPRMGYVKRPRTETSVVMAADIICLDDDDDDDGDGDGDGDNDNIEGALSSEEGNCEKSLDVHQEKEQSPSKTSDSNVQSSIITFKPCLFLPKCTDNTVGTGFHTNRLKMHADVLHDDEVEIICLDDDDNDDVSDDKKVGKKDLRSQEVEGIPVKRSVNTTLPARTGVDLDVIEITNAGENQSQQKMLTFGETEKQSSVDTKDKAANQIPEVHSNALCMDHSEHNLNVGAIETVANVAFDDGACCAIESENTNIKTQNSHEEMILVNRQMEYQGHAGDGVTLRRQIRHLEHQLRKLSTDIQRLQQTELTLDDMNSDASDYIKTERLEEKFLRVWKKLCSITHYPTFTGRMIEKTFSLEISGYPVIGKEVSELINKYRTFPDYQDIYDIVSSCNDKYSLHLKEATVESLSRNIFTNVGNRLQQLRKLDLAEQMKTYMPDILRSYDDPAIYDLELCQKLEENQILGRKNLEQVFVTFSEKQDTEGDTVIDNDASKILDKVEDKTAIVDDADDDGDDDDEEDDYENERDNDGLLMHHDLGHSSEVEPSSEAEAYSDLELSDSVFEARKDDAIEEEDDNDDERRSHKETLFISYDDGSSEADESPAAITNITGDCLSKVENDCKTAEEKTLGCLGAGQAVITIDEEGDANDKETTNCAGSKKQHMLKSSELKIRSELLDNIRRMTSNISFNQASNLAKSSQETAETSVEDESNEKIGENSTDSTSDRKEMDVIDTVLFHSETIDAHLCKEDSELIGSSTLKASNQWRWSKEEDLKEPVNNKIVEKSRTCLKGSRQETVMCRQDVEKIKEVEVDTVCREDETMSSSAVDTNAAVMPFFSNCVTNFCTEMASAPCPAALDMSVSVVRDLAVTTTFNMNTGLMLTSEYLDIPLLEMAKANDDTPEVIIEESSSAETTTQVRGDGEMQVKTDAMLFPEAAAEVKVNISDVHYSTAEPTVAVSTVTEVMHASDAATEQWALVPLPLDHNTGKTNSDIEFSRGSSNSFRSSSVLDDTIISQCSHKSNVEGLLPDEMCMSSDLELQLDSSETPEDHQVSYFSSLVDPKKPILKDALEKSKLLLDVLREASKRELIAETSSFNLNNGICEEGISKVEMGVHLEETCTEEQSFSRQQLHLSERSFSESCNVVSEQLVNTQHCSKKTELLLQEKHYEEKTCKDEHQTRLSIRSVSFQDRCKKNVPQVGQTRKTGIPGSPGQSGDTISQSKENIIELDSDFE